VGDLPNAERSRTEKKDFKLTYERLTCRICVPPSAGGMLMPYAFFSRGAFIMKSFILAIASLFLVGASLARAQQPPPKDPIAEAEPYLDKQTGLTFPVTIGKLKLDGTKDYGDPKLGVGIRYRLGASMHIDTIIYNLGKEKITSDIDGPELKEQVDSSVDNIKTYAEKGFYQDLQLHAPKVVPLSAAEGAPKAHKVSCVFTLAGKPRESCLYLFVYKNHFVKVRATWELDTKDASVKELDGLMEWLGGKIREQ
jgi:hypothetical protein